MLEIEFTEPFCHQQGFVFIPLSGTDRADAKFPVAGANNPHQRACQHTINTKPAKVKFLFRKKNYSKLKLKLAQ